MLLLGLLCLPFVLLAECVNLCLSWTVERTIDLNGIDLWWCWMVDQTYTCCIGPVNCDNYRIFPPVTVFPFQHH